MRVSYKWLQEYVDVNISPQELADRLTMAGVAVENVHYLGEGITNVVTGQILKIDPHPNADKLVICQVTTGEEDRLQIVTGATNVREGHKIPVAKVGAKLPSGLVIKKAKLRGEVSQGMLCSGQELGIDNGLLPPEQQNGIMILPQDTPLNLDIVEYLGLDDYILELDLTPNRGDCLSMIGVAREVAALLGVEMKMPAAPLEEGEERVEELAAIDIQAADLCRRYVGRVIKGVQIGPSPSWMQQRLRAAGIRPINNIVDVTNYVMLELGQPLHAFDYDKLAGHRIIVRRAKENESIKTLDQQERPLNENMLAICDAGGPVAVAGVMGGLDSEVTAETVNVLIESAYFDPVSVRRTSKALGLRSESSARFEKGIDIGGCVRAADRAAYLMQQLAGGTVARGVIDSYPEPVVEKTVKLRPARVEHVLGIPVEEQKIVDILTALQFKVQREGENLLVTVPTFRPDVSIEVDLIEEVARVYGYNQVPDTLIYGPATQGKRSENQQLVYDIRNILVGCGLTEVITYGFVSPKVADLMNLPQDSKFRNVLVLQNPLSEEQSVMRTVLVPNLLEVLKRNHNRQIQNGAIFEIGRVFYPREGQNLPEERLVLAMVFSGYTEKSWNSEAEPMDFFFAKGVVEKLFAGIGLVEARFVRHTDPSFHPGRTAAIEVKGKTIGVLGELHPNVLENYGLPHRAVACKIDLLDLIETELQKPRYQPLPKFPAVERDLAVVVKQEVQTRDMIDVINKAAGKILKSVSVFDVYRGAQVQEGYKSQAFSLLFQAPDRTLTDEEVAKQTEKIFRALNKEFAAELRK
ncbi:phenylalanyl-tRNA synthetase beta chain [Desulfohalotomaculum tongense]|uniref:phenylalanine--tRNA ligase subunit beta n=1 Tax=Desulforadius tongensis TaxID=1216062 RepID=UPI00195EF328|nr:phenylalanine--tRNA ligase subunit beta [Desulforadius tongensis]MBM7854783.1 phenylalanyl-tRNA synthetase beta chain [Desulforadius tongensis]